MSTPAALRQTVERGLAITDPTERRRALGVLRGELTDLLARVQRGLDEADLQDQGAAIGEGRLRDVARGEADLRRELVRRGMATDEDLAAMGVPSHGELDRLDEEGVLAEWADDMYVEVAEARRGGASPGEVNNRLRAALRARVLGGE